MDQSLLKIYSQECQWPERIKVLNQPESLLKYLQSKTSPQSQSCMGIPKSLSQLIQYLRYGLALQDVSFGYMFLDIDSQNQIRDVSCQRIAEDPNLNIKFTLPSLLIQRNFPQKTLLDLTLYRVGDKYSHSNLILIDRKTQTYERFEPHGSQGSYDQNDQINQYLRSHPDFKGWKYISSLDFCPKLGPQAIQKNLSKTCKDSGFCIVYSVLYAHLRIISPWSSQEIVQKMVAGTPQQILDMILRYLYILETYIIPVFKDSHLSEIYQMNRKFNSCNLVPLYQELPSVISKFLTTHISSYLDPFDESELKGEILYDLNVIKHKYRDLKEPTAQTQLNVLKGFLNQKLSELIPYSVAYPYLSHFFPIKDIDQALFKSGQSDAFAELQKSRSNLSLPHHRAKFMSYAITTQDPFNIFMVLSLFNFDPITGAQGYVWLLDRPDNNSTRELIELIPSLLNDNFLLVPQKQAKFQQIIDTTTKKYPELTEMLQQVS